MFSISNTCRLTCSFLVGIALAFAASAEEPEYVGQQDCKMCHNKKAEGEQWAVWKNMMHSKAFETLKTDHAKEVAKAAGVTVPPSEAAECLKCHVTAYNVETKSAPAKIKMTDGVQCESCHGPASLHLADGKAVMFQKDKSVDISKNIKQGSEETCLQCHNDGNPTWDPHKYTTESGEKTGFDFKQAYAKIAHPNPTKKKE